MAQASRLMRSGLSPSERLLAIGLSGFRLTSTIGANVQ